MISSRRSKSKIAMSATRVMNKDVGERAGGLRSTAEISGTPLLSYQAGGWSSFGHRFRGARWRAAARSGQCRHDQSAKSPAYDPVWVSVQSVGGT
jgi:hypothetical protein